MTRRQRERELRWALEAKGRAGLLPPNGCPSCGADLSDPGVPGEYAAYARLFSLVLEIKQAGGFVWMCPRCGHEWGPHPEPVG